MLKRNIEESGEYYQNILNAMTPNLFQMNGYQPMMQDLFAKGLFDEDARRYFRLSDRFSSNESIFLKWEPKNSCILFILFAIFNPPTNKGKSKLAY